MSTTFPRRRVSINIVAAGAGDNVVLAAVPGKRLAVMGYVLVGSVAGINPKWRSAANDISGAMALAANGGVVAPISPDGDPWLLTNAGEALNINVAAAGNLGGHAIIEER